MKTLDLEQPATTTGQQPIAVTMTPQLDLQYPIEFVLDNLEAQEVCLAGTFNNWDPGKNPLKKRKHGRWQTTIQLLPGRYEYRFVVDGQWTGDPKATETAPNPYGTENSVLVVREKGRRSSRGSTWTSQA